jgi:hypothetical protein
MTDRMKKTLCSGGCGRKAAHGLKWTCASCVVKAIVKGPASDKPSRRDGGCSCDFYPSCQCGERDAEYPNE